MQSLFYETYDARIGSVELHYSVQPKNIYTVTLYVKVDTYAKTYRWECRIWGNGIEKGSEMKDRKDDKNIFKILKTEDCFNKR